MHRKQDHEIRVLNEQAGIYGTLSAVYGSAYKPHTMKHFPVIINAVRYLRTVLKTKGNEKIILKPIKGATAGLHFGSTGNIFCDMRCSTFSLVEIIAHELVHAEQTFQGRLQQVGMQRLWEGKTYNYPKSYQEYRNLPWEKEAFDRQGELARQALKGLI